MKKSQPKLLAVAGTGAARFIQVLTEQVDPLGDNTQDGWKEPTEAVSVSCGKDEMEIGPTRTELENVLANAIKIESSDFNEENISLDGLMSPKRKYSENEESEDDSSFTSKSQDFSETVTEMHYQRQTALNINNPVKKTTLEQTPRASNSRIISSSTDNIGRHIVSESQNRIKQYVDNEDFKMELDGVNNKRRQSQYDVVSNQATQLQMYKARIRELEQENRYLQGIITSKLDVIIQNSAEQNEHIDKLVARSKSTSQPATQKSLHKTVFMLRPLNTEEELQQLDEIVGTNQTYRAHVVEYLKRESNRTDVENLLHDAIDLLFCKRFFARMTWTGISRTGAPKVQLCKYENIIRLFQLVGESESETPTLRYIVEYLKNKLKHAKSRIHIPLTRKTSSHKKIKKTTSDNIV
uniref:DUF4806 domain-containing protein n=1 Tax=Anopheles gambiae TaxID=7165 RepID=A0A453Z0P7_ANOGA